MLITTVLASLNTASAACRPSLSAVLSQLQPPAPTPHARIVGMSPIHVETIDATTFVLSINDNDAVLVYQVQGTLISIESARTAPHLKRQGLNHRLFAEMLRRHPETKSIESTLMEDNFEAYRRTDESLPCAARILATPAARVRVLHGFTTVSECTPSALYVVLRMTRP